VSLVYNRLLLVVVCTPCSEDSIVLDESTFDRTTRSAAKTD